MHKFFKIALLLIFPSLLLLFSCRFGSSDKASIKGQFTNSANTKLLLFELLPDSTHLADSNTTDAEGNFKFSISPRETGFYLLRRDAHNYITLIVSKGENILLSGDGKNLNKTYTVQGSEESSVLREYDQFTSLNQVKVDSLSSIFKKSQDLKNFPEIRQQLDSAFYVIFNNQHELTVNFLKKNLSSIAALMVTNRTFGQSEIISLASDFPLFSAIDSSLMLKYPSNSQVIDYHKIIEAYRPQYEALANNRTKLQPGTEMMEISLPDAEGKQIKLSSLKGKYTLLYFWASWNAPCRKMNIELTSIYDEFHAKGFEIYGISLDPVQKEWIEAYKKDKASWIQVNDTAGLNSSVAKNYKINSIPSGILFGKDGKVISGNIKTAELKNLLTGKL